MAAKHEWSEADWSEFLAKRAAHGRTVNIARRFGISPALVRKIGKRLDAEAPPPVETRVLEQNWWPLPAGHPVTWSAITRNTSLEGAPYQLW